MRDCRRGEHSKKLITRALSYARGESSELPDEILCGRLIERFGVQAAFGRLLSFGEMLRISAAENIVRAYQERTQYRDSAGGENWAEWAARAPDLNRILIMAERLDDPDDGNNNC